MKQAIIDFLLGVNEEQKFIPEHVNVQQYFDKVFSSAIILPLIEEGKIMGALAFYCNDYINKRAYFTFLAISGTQRKKGLGSYLMKMGLQFVELNGFKTVEAEVYKNNVQSFKMCEKLGFVIKEDKGGFYIMKKDLTDKET